MHRLDLKVAEFDLKRTLRGVPSHCLTPHFQSCLVSVGKVQRQMCILFAVLESPALKSASWGRLNEFFMINPDLGSQSVDSNLSPVL